LLLVHGVASRQDGVGADPGGPGGTGCWRPLGAAYLC